jgi:hypothetical protein
MFQEFATQHGMINDFGVGTYYKIDTKQDRKYPLMWITPKPTNFKPQENRYTFDIMFADILDGSESNLQDVWSDMDQLAQDFIRFFNTTYGETKGDYYDVRLDVNYYKEPFLHLLDNEAAGYFLRITIITPANSSYCINPTKA